MLTVSDRSRLRILWPHGPLPEGVVTFPIDLAAAFAQAAEIGADRMLLLLTVRAIRQRGYISDASVADLRWMLGVGRLWLARQLQRLSEQGQIVFDRADDDVIHIEITGVEAPRPLFGDEAGRAHIRHELPTHWFTQLLPRIGRRSFLAYLYVRSQEATSPVPTIDLGDLARSTGACCLLDARWLIARLRWFGLIERGEHGLVVLDPAPLTVAQRLYLRLLATGAIPATRWARRCLVVLALALGGGVILLVS